MMQPFKVLFLIFVSIMLIILINITTTVSEQEYCRYVKGENIFGLPEKVCLNEDGTWRYHD